MIGCVTVNVGYSAPPGAADGCDTVAEGEAIFGAAVGLLGANGAAVTGAAAAGANDNATAGATVGIAESAATVGA